MTKKFVTVTTALDIPLAHVYKSHLEANGIKCFIKNEHFVAAIPILSNAAGWIEVQVLETDVSKAMKIIQNLNVE